VRASLSSLMANKPAQPLSDADAAKAAAKWRRAAIGIALVAAIMTIAPLAIQYALSRPTEESATSETQPDETVAEPKEEDEEAAAEKEEEEEKEVKVSKPASSWMPFSGGSWGGGSSSSSDVRSCSQAANSARRGGPAPKHPGLGKAMEKSGGSLLGAAVQSLHSVEVQTDDDANAAEAYQACISGR